MWLQQQCSSNNNRNNDDPTTTTRTTFIAENRWKSRTWCTHNVNDDWWPLWPWSALLQSLLLLWYSPQSQMISVSMFADTSVIRFRRKLLLTTDPEHHPMYKYKNMTTNGFKQSGWPNYILHTSKKPCKTLTSIGPPLDLWPILSTTPFISKKIWQKKRFQINWLAEIHIADMLCLVCCRHGVLGIQSHILLLYLCLWSSFLLWQKCHQINKSNKIIMNQHEQTPRPQHASSAAAGIARLQSGCRIRAQYRSQYWQFCRCTAHATTQASCTHSNANLAIALCLYNILLTWTLLALATNP